MKQVVSKQERRTINVFDKDTTNKISSHDRVKRYLDTGDERNKEQISNIKPFNKLSASGDRRYKDISMGTKEKFCEYNKNVNDNIRPPSLRRMESKMGYELGTELEPKTATIDRRFMKKERKPYRGPSILRRM